MNPLGYRVVVKLIKEPNMTDAGLYLPEGAKENMQESLLAHVVEVASALDEDTDEEANVSGVPMGATVLIPKTSGVRIPWDEELRIIETKHILAVVEEVDVI
ncbi:MAG: co-chaperone GroES [Deltaproteobacteria bacterium]|nr:co-chaperone GroES [Deltaproteobacteria bacterium]